MKRFPAVGSYKSAVGLKQKNPNLKVMLAIGGWNEGIGVKKQKQVSPLMSRTLDTPFTTTLYSCSKKVLYTPKVC